MATKSMSVDKAHEVLRQDYFDDVRGLAEDVRQWWDQNEDADRDDLIEYLDESVDGHGRVIYTGQAIECLRYSDNDAAYFDEMGEWPSGKDGMPWSQLAYFAFRADGGGRKAEMLFLLQWQNLDPIVLV